MRECPRTRVPYVARAALAPIEKFCAPFSHLFLRAHMYVCTHHCIDCGFDYSHCFCALAVRYRSLAFYYCTTAVSTADHGQCYTSYVEAEIVIQRRFFDGRRLVLPSHRVTWTAVAQPMAVQDQEDVCALLIGQKTGARGARACPAWGRVL